MPHVGHVPNDFALLVLTIATAHEEGGLPWTEPEDVVSIMAVHYSRQTTRQQVGRAFRQLEHFGLVAKTDKYWKKGVQGWVVTPLGKQTAHHHRGEEIRGMLRRNGSVAEHNRRFEGHQRTWGYLVDSMNDKYERRGPPRDGAEAAQVIDDAYQLGVERGMWLAEGQHADNRGSFPDRLIRTETTMARSLVPRKNPAGKLLEITPEFVEVFSQLYSGQWDPLYAILSRAAARGYVFWGSDLDPEHTSSIEIADGGLWMEASDEEVDRVEQEALRILDGDYSPQMEDEAVADQFEGAASDMLETIAVYRGEAVHGGPAPWTSEEW